MNVLPRATRGRGRGPQNAQALAAAQPEPGQQSLAEHFGTSASATSQAQTGSSLRRAQPEQVEMADSDDELDHVEPGEPEDEMEFEQLLSHLSRPGAVRSRPR
jgi:hypothetical protein